MLSSLLRSRAAKGALVGRFAAPLASAFKPKALSTDRKEAKGDLRVVHFKLTPQPHPLGVEKHWQNPIAHQVWSEEELAKIAVTHEPTNNFHKKAAHAAIQLVRKTFDKVTDYDPQRMTIDKWLTRFIFLETVAGCPGMVAGMCRHLRSLRLMKRDYGWIHTLLEEAENERMHLLTFMHMKKPSVLFRLMVILTQGVFMNGFFVAYCLSPRFCHRFVGYLEEEAVKTYTHCLRDIDEGKIWVGAPAPVIAINYWKLKQDATMRDVIAAVRADEANHRDVNHTFAGLQREDVNPYVDKKH